MFSHQNQIKNPSAKNNHYTLFLKYKNQYIPTWGSIISNFNSNYDLVKKKNAVKHDHK